MRKDVKKAWVAALRSGEYLQGRSALGVIEKDSDEKKYCCLGVLCDVIDRKFEDIKSAIDLELEWNRDFPFPDRTLLSVNVNDNNVRREHLSFLPRSVTQAVEIPPGPDISRDSGEFVNENGTHRSLSGMNDNGSSFAEIADAIERYF